MKQLLSLLLLLLCISCSHDLPQGSLTLLVHPAASLTRAGEVDDAKITDINLFIFNAQGFLEERVWVPSRSMHLTDGVWRYEAKMLLNGPYTILAAANLGYQLQLRSLEELREYRYYLAYPDEFSGGLPMSLYLENVGAGEGKVVDARLERLVARIDLCIDRRALLPDILFKVSQVQVGGCPSSALLFAPNKVENDAQLFRRGYTKSGREVSALNQDNVNGVSGELSLYLLENRQGDLLKNVISDSGKVFDDPILGKCCSYIQIKAEYQSPSIHSSPESRLVYRFYLGEGLDNFDVTRNSRYRITVRPEGDGLSEDSWRVDQSELTE